MSMEEKMPETVFRGGSKSARTGFLGDGRRD